MPRRLLAMTIVAVAALAVAGPAAAQDTAPPCAPASEPAALLDAPDRLAYGRTGRARIVGGPGASAVGRALIQVGDAAPVAGPVRFTQRLDDPPLTVRLLTTELTAAGPCERVVDHVVRGFRRVAVPSGCHRALVRPRRLGMCTVDWGWGADRLRWRGWNRDLARGRGRWDPECAPLRVPQPCDPPVRARFELSRIRFCHSLDVYVYTRMRVRPRGERAHTEALSCPVVFDGGGEA